MGLQLTLNKESNQLYHTFTDAYWAIKDIGYTTEDVYAKLICYPSREASHKQGEVVSSSLIVGGSYLPIIDCALYKWEFTAKVSEMFPNGIPLSSNEQKTAIYNWIKSYTQLDFIDVLEDEE